VGLITHRPDRTGGLPSTCLSAPSAGLARLEGQVLVVRVFLYGSPEANDFARRVFTLLNTLNNLRVVGGWMLRAASVKSTAATKDQLASAKIKHDNLMERTVQALRDAVDWFIDHNTDSFSVPPVGFTSKQWLFHLIEAAELAGEASLCLSGNFTGFHHSRIVSDEGRISTRAALAERTESARALLAECTTKLSAARSHLWRQNRNLRSAAQAAAAILKSVDPLKKNSPKETPESPAIPEYLASWREILISLEMKNNREDKQKVSRLNETYSGPIIPGGQGKQPLANKQKLLAWFTNLEIQFQDQLNQAKGKSADAESQHNWGRTGTAAPDIGGGVKKRRRNRKP
jgi:hypothetical protein